jgi:hypothetical protein
MGCVDKKSKLECELVNHVLGWTLLRLVPRDRIQVRATMLQQNKDGEIEAQTRRDEIANDVQVGENITVRSNDVDDPFWIMLVTKCIHVIEECFETMPLKKEMKSFVDIGTIGYKKGVGPTP